MIDTSLKLYSCLLLVLVSLLQGSVFATEYIYRDLMGNTLPPQKCSARTEAEAAASDDYNLKKHARIFCESQGYGWHVEQRKSTGKLVCEECSEGGDNGRFRCHMEDVVVQCKRIKPGSVGLIPGQG
ncbi:MULTISPECIES: hypothetical protein [Methylococcus]|jgi:hypothetical protein|uniref:hypothetical protein n=1 Tax=Methylococcus TaxID=413 RepID=UPI002FDB7509